MQTRNDTDPTLGELFLAGERVPPGVYRSIENRRVIQLEEEDFLPASLDGRIACYERIQSFALINYRAAPGNCIKTE